jgi:hypothetical protein
MNELDILARKYDTDKRTNDIGKNIYHGYTDIYNKYLFNYKNQYENILEIGVKNGASHKMWYDYFPNAMIYGIDNFSDPYCNVTKEDIENDRIKILVSDQTDENEINKFFKDIELDMIIDDGSHCSWHQQKSFKFLFPRLKSRGYYFIEDLAVCYERRFREFDDERSSTLRWLELMQTGNPFSHYINEEEMDTMLDNISTIEIIGELGIIKKI